MEEDEEFELLVKAAVKEAATIALNQAIDLVRDIVSTTDDCADFIIPALEELRDSIE